jgi:hypothetical protein
MVFFTLLLQAFARGLEMEVEGEPVLGLQPEGDKESVHAPTAFRYRLQAAEDSRL